MDLPSVTLRAGRIYGLMVDPTDVPPEGTNHMNDDPVLWGLEYFGDGVGHEKPMCEIIITAANHAADPPSDGYPGGLKPNGYHYTWDGAKPFEEPRATGR